MLCVGACAVYVQCARCLLVLLFTHWSLPLTKSVLCVFGSHTHTTNADVVLFEISVYDLVQIWSRT